MTRLTFSALVDGPSDRALLPIIEWALNRVGCRYPAVGDIITPANLRKIGHGAKTLEQKIPLVLEYFPCDLLLIHRDAERESLATRLTEIRDAVVQVEASRPTPHSVPIVPVRMHEAWLLFSEEAIRFAADNPHGNTPLALPSIKDCEALSDPKDTLDDLLKRASGFSGGRLRRFDCATARSRIVGNIVDFSPLESLEAFQTFLATLKETLRYSGWL